MKQHIELIYLCVTFFVAVWAIRSRSRFVIIWLAVFSIYKIITSITATEITVEEVTANEQYQIKLKHNPIAVVGINSEEHLFPAFSKDYTFSGDTIQLIARRPSPDKIGKLVYRVTYKYKKFF